MDFNIIYIIIIFIIIIFILYFNVQFNKIYNKVNNDNTNTNNNTNNNNNLNNNYMEKRMINNDEFKKPSGFVNELITKPDIYNENNEYIKMFDFKISNNDLLEYKNDNDIGFNPKVKEDKKELPFANYNINCL